ncbi:acetylhydrolase [Roseomonas sp. NAR14]|uniref:Acetylhydrolase n=1 Tax=Roseomonas acroporae TaxID=2937791 RepID=A0A9X1Y7S4_9PROT|nr:acetylhydrolase [Roseomonas acroporae]MCK8785529.1 acetylhydrolase [Roseomonas acroporae]
MTRRDALRLPALLGAAALPSVPPGTAHATSADASITQTWHDPARDRDIPVRLRLPEVPDRAPAVLISHGLGGTRDGLGYLGRAFAEAGFIAVHLQHPGSDGAVWRGAADAAASLAAAALDPRNALDRLRDGIFAIDELLRRESAFGDPLRGRLDPTRLAVAGHSFGAWTVQHLLGERLPGGDHGLALPERRLRAGVALSPIPPRGLPPRLAFARMSAPLLHVTGTEDQGYIEGARPADRLIPFQAIRNVPQALLVLDGATHAAFADQAEAGARWADTTYHARVAAVSVLFLRATLMADPAAAAALREGARRGPLALLAPRDRLETRDFAPPS